LTNEKEIDLLNFVEQGGCSAKLSASELNKALAGLPKNETQESNLLILTLMMMRVFIKSMMIMHLFKQPIFFLQYVPTHMILGKLQLLMRLAIYMLWADRY